MMKSKKYSYQSKLCYLPGKILDLEIGQDFLAILYTLKNYTEGHNKELWLGPWFNISMGRLSYIFMNAFPML